MERITRKIAHAIEAVIRRGNDAEVRKRETM